jgi:hypothetical protein
MDLPELEERIAAVLEIINPADLASKLAVREAAHGSIVAAHVKMSITVSRYVLRSKDSIEKAERLANAAKAFLGSTKSATAIVPLREAVKRIEDECRQLIPNPAKRPTARDKEIAAQAAHDLMTLLGLSITGTRTGMFCQIAAAIYGDAGANLYHQCTKVLGREAT